jgi:ABC-type bacteriocin/lantibiotic exporter with double-glycine peptidase domain
LRRLDTNSVCLERTSDYCKLDQEEVDPHLKEVPPASWPKNGSIAITGVEARYAQDLPAVISGATGCGKSTLAKALFSFVEVTKGNIVIDDIGGFLNGTD